jgi:hypothetical protein
MSTPSGTEPQIAASSSPVVGLKLSSNLVVAEPIAAPEDDATTATPISDGEAIIDQTTTTTQANVKTSFSLRQADLFGYGSGDYVSMLDKTIRIIGKCGNGVWVLLCNILVHLIDRGGVSEVALVTQGRTRKPEACSFAATIVDTEYGREDLCRIIREFKFRYDLDGKHRCIIMWESTNLLIRAANDGSDAAGNDADSELREEIQSLLMNGHHYGITLIIYDQYVVGGGVAHASLQCDYVILFQENFKSMRQKLHSVVASAVQPFSTFDRMMQWLPGFHALLIGKSVFDTETSVRWIKSSNDENHRPRHIFPNLALPQLTPTPTTPDLAEIGSALLATSTSIAAVSSQTGEEIKRVAETLSDISTKLSTLINLFTEKQPNRSAPATPVLGPNIKCDIESESESDSENESGGEDVKVIEPKTLYITPMNITDRTSTGFVELLGSSMRVVSQARYGHCELAMNILNQLADSGIVELAIVGAVNYFDARDLTTLLPKVSHPMEHLGEIVRGFLERSVDGRHRCIMLLYPQSDLNRALRCSDSAKNPQTDSGSSETTHVQSAIAELFANYRRCGITLIMYDQYMVENSALFKRLNFDHVFIGACHMRTMQRRVCDAVQFESLTLDVLREVAIRNERCDFLAVVGPNAADCERRRLQWIRAREEPPREKLAAINAAGTASTRLSGLYPYVPQHAE